MHVVILNRSEVAVRDLTTSIGDNAANRSVGAGFSGGIPLDIIDSSSLCKVPRAAVAALGMTSL